MIACYLAPALLSAASVYRWVDEEGVTHYSDQLAPGATEIPFTYRTRSDRAGQVTGVADLVCPQVKSKSTMPAQRAPEKELMQPAIDRDPPELQAMPQAPDRDVLNHFRPFSEVPFSGHIRRIAVWGDSHIAAGFFGDELRKVLLFSGVRVEKGFVPPYMVRRGAWIPVRKTCVGSGWTFSAAYLSRATVNYGPALAEMRSDQSGAYVWLDMRNAKRESDVQSLRLLYRPTVAEARISVSIDDGPETMHVLAPADVSVAEHSREIVLKGDAGLSTVKIHIAVGEVALQGLYIDRDLVGGVVFDEFGISGATVNGWAQIDTASLSRVLRQRSYDAVVLAFGTNEAAGDFDEERYAMLLSRALTNLRKVFPEAPCLLVGPPDRGFLVKRQRGKVGRKKSVQPPLGPSYLRFSNIHEKITQIQSDVGNTFGCRNWSWQRAMGGPGAAYSWARRSPSLMAYDLIHLTEPGYRKSADELARFLGWMR